MNIEAIREKLEQYLQFIQEWLQSPVFYWQIGLIVLSILLAWVISRMLIRGIPLFHQPSPDAPKNRLRQISYQLRFLLFPILNITVLGIAREVGQNIIDSVWLIVISQGLAVIFFLYKLILRFIKHDFIQALCRWIIIPAATLQVFGLLDELIVYLDSASIVIGNIRVSAYFLIRVAIFGSILFWLGRASNKSGQHIIRKQESLDIATREVLAKLFQVLVSIVVFILLMQVLGINLTALAVLGGAVGVGLGFGLQSIASNFVSGMIILLDHSLTVGDFIELEDGRTGTISELNMRSTTLETYDGKDIVVPNETFITTSFVNWTHKDNKQRYDMTFQVAYNTDIHKLLDLLKEIMTSHPQIISGENASKEELPDAEIAGFGDSGVDILIEYWIEGIDDGKNRINADLYLMIWDALHEHNIDFPFPQREVRILNPEKLS